MNLDEVYICGGRVCEDTLCPKDHEVIFVGHRVHED
jgi:hypothetical protein